MALAQQHDHAAHQAPDAVSAGDTREVVEFPPDLKQHMLANMRGHLQTLQEIQEALSAKNEDKAARMAEQMLGLSSLQLHGAHVIGKFMPQGMRDAGSEMHRSASRFAIEAQNASVTGDVRPALQALSRVTAGCVACHAGYRLK